MGRITSANINIWGRVAVSGLFFFFFCGGVWAIRFPVPPGYMTRCPWTTHGNSGSCATTIFPKGLNKVHIQSEMYLRCYLVNYVIGMFRFYNCVGVDQAQIKSNTWRFVSLSRKVTVVDLVWHACVNKHSNKKELTSDWISTKWQPKAIWDSQSGSNFLFFLFHQSKHQTLEELAFAKWPKHNESCFRGLLCGSADCR